MEINLETLYVDIRSQLAGLCKAKLLYTILMPGYTTIAIECNVARNTISLDVATEPV